MMKQDSIPTLTSELMQDSLDEYPDEVLECEWNPALEQVLRLRLNRKESVTHLFLNTEPPELL